MSAGRRSLPWWASLAALLVADTVYGFQQTAITPALPVIQHSLHASREWTTWLFSGYFVVASVAPVFLGKLADRSGKRRIYLGALIVFLLGSVGAAAAPTIGVLVTFRVIQGAGGIVFPLSFSILRDHLPSERVSAGIGVLSGGFGVGALGGFVVGGALTEELSWRWIFIVGALALAVGALLVRLTVEADTTRTPRRLDTPGAALFGAAMAGLIIAITEGPQRGWDAPAVIILLVVAAVAAGSWVVRELHTAEPLMDLRVLSARPVLLTNVASMVVGYAVIGANVLIPFLLDADGGLTALGLAAGPLLIGIVLIPRAVGQAVGGPASTPLIRRLGPGPAFACAMVCVAGGTLGLGLWRADFWNLLVELGAVGLGFGLAIAIAGSVVTLSADPRETSIATSINSVLRRVGGAIGAQVAAALLAAITIGGGKPSASAFTVAFIAAAAVALVGAVATLFIRTPRPAS